MDEIWQLHPVWLDYEVSNCGRVRRATARKGTRVGKILKMHLSDSGYHTVHVGGRHRKVHVLMLETFARPGSDGEEGRHLDDIKTNNVLSNLSWGTHADNYRDRVANGGGNHGERHGLAKLKESDVIEIRALAGSTPAKILAERFAISKKYVRQIVLKQRWTHL